MQENHVILSVISSVQPRRGARGSCRGRGGGREGRTGKGASSKPGGREAEGSGSHRSRRRP